MPTYCLPRYKVPREGEEERREKKKVKEKESRSIYISHARRPLALVVPTLVALINSMTASVYRSSAIKALTEVLLGLAVDALTL